MHNACSGIEAPRKRNLHQLEPWIASVALAYTTTTLPSHQTYKIWKCNRNKITTELNSNARGPIMLQSQYRWIWKDQKYKKIDRKYILSITSWLTQLPTNHHHTNRKMLAEELKATKRKLQLEEVQLKPWIVYIHTTTLPSHPKPTSTPTIWTMKS